MVVSGGLGTGGARLGTGGLYNPATDTWALMNNTGAPSGRFRHSAVWTATEMIVWGGDIGLGDGARFRPTSNTWTPMTPTDAPAGRSRHFAFWTGREMLLWGGYNGNLFNHTWSYHPRPLGVTLTFGPITPGGTYTVQRSHDLTAGSWSTLSGAVHSDFGSERTVIDPYVTGDKAFYRVFTTGP